MGQDFFIRRAEIIRRDLPGQNPADIIVLQQLEGNLIYPKVVGKSVGLPAIFVLMAVIVGADAFGIVGMLISVPVFSVSYTLITRWVKYRIKEKHIDEASI